MQVVGVWRRGVGLQDVKGEGMGETLKGDDGILQDMDSVDLCKSRLGQCRIKFLCLLLSSMGLHSVVSLWICTM